jgi:hypothetical protein
MRNPRTPLTTLGVSTMSLVFWLASAQGIPAEEKPKQDEHAAHHPAEEAKEKPTPGKAMSMQMPPGMKMRCQMMMNMRVRPNDPAAVLALRDQLDLTDQQVIQLHQLIAQAREKTEGLLTAEQKKKLEPLADLPETGREMHERMMQHMQKMGKDERQMKCPMMEMMK